MSSSSAFSAARRADMPELFSSSLSAVIASNSPLSATAICRSSRPGGCALLALPVSFAGSNYAAAAERRPIPCKTLNTRRLGGDAPGVKESALDGSDNLAFLVVEPTCVVGQHERLLGICRIAAKFLDSLRCNSEALCYKLDCRDACAAATQHSTDSRVLHTYT